METRHYETIIELLSDKVRELEGLNGFLQWKCDGLEEKLKAAENSNKERNKE